MRNRHIHILAFFLALLLLGGWLPAWANDGPEHDLQSWSMVTLQGPAQGRIKTYMEVQGRVGDELSELDRLLIRPALGVQLAKPWSLWQGYLYTLGYQPVHQEEHRLWQQSLVEHTFKEVGIANRTRLEERFIENADNPSFRFRHMLRLTKPMGKSKKWYLATYDEIFFNLSSTSGGPQGGFDQNRLFVGLGKQLNKTVRLEGGYIANLVNRQSPAENRLNHILLLWMHMGF